MDAVLDRDGLDALLHALRADGYSVVGPTVRDGCILYDEISSCADLPEGWADEQAPGSYGLRGREDDALFGYACGPNSWKQYLFPPRTLLVRSHRTEDGFEAERPDDEAPRYAFVGVRPCDLRAIGVQDRVFLGGAHPDATYARRREAFTVAVDCGDPADTCFCTSMGGGPRAEGDFDLALTELSGTSAHRFVVRVGSPRGHEMLERLPRAAVTDEDRAAALTVTNRAAASITRHVDTAGLPGLLTSGPERSPWQQVAERCIACGNCTMVCPTCFCSTVEDVTDLSGDVAERWRRWDSCFTLEFSYVHGGSVRTSVAARYRQWLTHKLATWHDQFGTSGCVGCGRCSTWCPVAIDLTAEVAAHRAAAATVGSPR